jgi:hypothetical protein
MVKEEGLAGAPIFVVDRCAILKRYRFDIPLVVVMSGALRAGLTLRNFLQKKYCPVVATVIMNSRLFRPSVENFPGCMLCASPLR